MAVRDIRKEAIVLKSTIGTMEEEQEDWKWFLREERIDAVPT
jgi:hypothetical protein